MSTHTAAELPTVRYLGPADIASAAAAIVDGRDPGLKDCHAEGVAQVFAAAVTIRARRAWRAAAVEAMLREASRMPGEAELAAELEDQPMPQPIRRRYGRAVHRPDRIVRDILTLPEAAAMLALLSGAVALATRMPGWVIDGALGEGGTQHDLASVQAHYLHNYLRQKVMGDPIHRDGYRVGFDGPPATYAAPKAEFLPPELRAWANTLPADEAAGWLDVKELETALGEIHEAGAAIMAAYGQAFDRIGWPVSAVHPGPPIGLSIVPPVPGSPPPPGVPPMGFKPPRMTPRGDGDGDE